MAIKRTTPTYIEPLRISEDRKGFVIENGTLPERISLYAQYLDNLQKGSEPFLTENELDILEKKIEESTKDSDILFNIRRLFNGCLTFARQLMTLSKNWQAEAEGLAVLCTRWEGYEKTAHIINRLLGELNNQSLINLKDNKKQVISILNEVLSYKETESQPDVEYRILLQKSLPLFKEDSLYSNSAIQVTPYIGGENGLYIQIENKIKSATETLQMLKAAVVTFTKFITTPIKIGKGTKMTIGESIIPEIVESLVKYPDYFPFMGNMDSGKFLRERRGSTSLPFKKEYAVIPSYQEVTLVPQYVESAKGHLKFAFGDFYDQKKY